MNTDETKKIEDEKNTLSEVEKSLAKQISYEIGTENEELEEGELMKKKTPKWIYIAGGIGGVLLVIALIAILYVNGLLDKINFDNGLNISLQDETFDEDDISGAHDEFNPNDIDWASISERTKKEGVINILLVGEEAIADFGRGRSDTMMIATVNIEQKALKLTSLMRDTYVQIPGFSDNKLNAAYKNGGIPLLYETIKLNFNIEMDGYILVDFSSFETLIDKLGGVDITLSLNEAKYLNRTNYISKREFRNVREGLNSLNGNQALGYSRVRYVQTIDNIRDDFGRTSRQRTVLNALFEKYKSKSVPELVLLLNDVLPLITTDIRKSDILNYISVVATLGVTEIQTMTIPVSNGFTNAKIRTMLVLLPDLPKNVKALHEFIFGESNLTIVPSVTNDYNKITTSQAVVATPTPTPTPIPVQTSTPKPTTVPDKVEVITPTKKPNPVETQQPVQTPDTEDVVLPDIEDDEIETIETPIPTKKPVETIAPQETTTPVGGTGEKPVEPTNTPVPTTSPTILDKVNP